jgi:hypothetical protein
MSFMDYEFKDKPHVRSDFIPGLPMYRQAMHFLFISVVMLTGHGMFKPASTSGRVYAMVKAFVLAILWSCYAAALTAIVVDPPMAKQVISNVMDFSTAYGTGTAACIGPAPEVATYLSINYPSMQLKIINSTDPSDLLRAVMNEECAGAILPGDELDFALGYTDKTGEFCHLRATGPPLGHLFRNMPWNVLSPLAGPTVNGYDAPSFWDAWFRIENRATQDLLLTAYKQLWFPTKRPLCADAQAMELKETAQGVMPVNVKEIGGILIFQAMGVVLSLIVYAWTKTYPSKEDFDILHQTSPADIFNAQMLRIEGIARILRQKHGELAAKKHEKVLA